MAEIQKVLDPQKMVTDPTLLSTLAKQSIDKDYVEFFQDYASRSLGKEHSPYAKFYHDLKSNKRFMVVSGLPMVDADGVKIEAGWRVAGINYFSEKNNLFWAKVQGTDIELRVRNDQPDGRKANDRLSYKPHLFLNGVEQSCSPSILLPIDPVNSNYLENTLEWDYSICKRRLRIIEGSVLGSWVFATKPLGEIRIKYNQIGDYRLRLGQFKVSDDEEVVKPEDFDQAAKLGGYPVTISDSATFYPDPATSVDGSVRHYHAEGVSWAELHDATDGDAVLYTDTTIYLYQIYCGISGALWRAIQRAFFLFDTSSLPDNANISDATLSLYGYLKQDIAGWAQALGLYASTPANNASLVIGDYDQVGATAFSSLITYANFSVVGYNDFVLNASGIAAISKTGISKFGTRGSTYDVLNTAPSWSDGAYHSLFSYAAEQGTDYKPKLVVTYTTGGVVGGSSPIVLLYNRMRRR